MEKIPNINITNPPNEIVKSEQIIKYYNEILDDIRDDRNEIDEVLRNFMDMVMNEGDATTSSKEALVNLLKIKSETADKKTKVVEMLMKSFLKDNSPKVGSVTQYNLVASQNKRKLLNALEEE